MSLTTEEFIARFQTLSGTTVGEKQKHLKELLKTLPDSEISNLDFSKLLPRTPLEEKLKIDALIHLKRVHDLVGVLKSENPASIKRIFKLGKWFFDSFVNVAAEDLINDIFPFVSYNVKVKLLNKLAIYLHNTDQADNIFNAIKTKYSLNLALKLLPACSLAIILSQIESGKKLPPSQLLSVIKKHPKQQVKLLDALARYTRLERQCNNIIKFLKLNHTDAFLQLHFKHDFNRKLGKRLTRKFIRNRKEEVIGDPKLYYNILHNKTIPKCLKGDFPKCFANLFPNKLEQFEDSRKRIVTRLKSLPPKINRLDLYLTTFQRVYGCEIWDHPSYVTIQLLKMLDTHERQSRLLSIYKNDISEDDWMSLHKTEISIPFFLKRISLTSDIDDRVRLIRLLVDTCKFNADSAGLGKVCNYMLSRHRNDNIRVRVAFLRQIQEDFLMENLEEVHWTCINDFLQIFSMNQQAYYDEDGLLEGYIHYRLKNNLSVSEQLKDWITTEKYSYNLFTDYPEFEKICLITIGQIICEGSYENKHIQFLSALLKWNKRHKNDEISLFAYPNCINYLKRMVEDKKWISSALPISLYLLEKATPQQKSEYLKLYLELADQQYGDLKIIDKYLKNNPVLLITYLDRIIHLVTRIGDKYTNIFLKRSQYLHHLDIPQRVVKICLEISQKRTKDHRDRVTRETALLAAAFLIPASEFMSFANPYQPIGFHADTNKQKLEIQKFICKSVRYLRPANEALPIILNYCKGDYLKLIRASLFSISGYTTEENLKPVLNELSNRSSYKYLLYVAFRNMDSNYVNNVINKLKDINKISIRRLVFKVVFNMFVKNPTDYIWNMLKSCADKLDVNDKESLNLLSEITKIPSGYLTVYQVLMWDILFKLPNKAGALDCKRTQLLNSIDAAGSQALPPSFIKTIINNCLFKSIEFDDFQNSVQTLACKYIIYCKNKNKQEERLKDTFSILKYYISKWTNPQHRCKPLSNCSKFLQNFCAPYLEMNNTLDSSILQLFYEMWIDTIPPQEAFADYLYLRFTLMYSILESTEKFFTQLAELCNDLTRTYGVIIVEFMYSIFEQVFTNYLNRNRDDSRYKFIEELINSQQSEACILFAILLIEDNEPCDSDIKRRHNLLIERLKKTESVSTILYLNRHIRGKTTLEYY